MVAIVQTLNSCVSSKLPTGSEIVQVAHVQADLRTSSELQITVCMLFKQELEQQRDVDNLQQEVANVTYASLHANGLH